MNKKKSHCPYWESNPNSSVIHPVAHWYTDYAISIQGQGRVQLQRANEAARPLQTWQAGPIEPAFLLQTSSHTDILLMSYSGITQQRNAIWIMA